MMRTRVGALTTIVLLTIGPAPAAADEAANRKLVQRYFVEMINDGRLAVADEILTADVRFTNPPTTATSRDELKKVITGLREAFPDVRFELADVVAESDSMAARWTLIGTHRGAFAGLQPTGKTIRVTGMDFFHITGGRISEVWVNMDVLGMMQQLGVIPGMTPAPPQ